MVSIKTTQASRYVQKPDPHAKAFLLHGTDPSLIRERGAALCEALRASLSDNAEFIRLSEDDLAAAPDRLAVEAQTASMFSPNKIVRARLSGRAATELAKFAWDQLPESTRVVLEAGNLNKQSKLRQIFETNKPLASVACHDGSDTASVSQLIRKELAAAGLTISRDAERYLAGVIGTDIGIARSEITKLITYAQDIDEISVEDVEAIVGDATDASLNTAVDTVLNSNCSGALAQMERLRASGTPPDVLLYALSQQLMRLLWLRSKIDAGDSADAALKAFRPPLHFRRADEIKKQVRRWDRTPLKQALTRVSRALQYARLHPDIAHQVASDTIFEVGRSSGPSGRR